jgi:hypothetical protein
MSKNLLTDRNAVVDSLAAELTSAAYPVLLRGGLGGSWVELELGLWKALAETVRKWAREWPQSGSPDDLAKWRKGLVAGLIDRAEFVAEELGVQEPLLLVESGLRQAFCSAISRARPGPEVYQGFNS